MKGDHHHDKFKFWSMVHKITFPLMCVCVSLGGGGLLLKYDSTVKSMGCSSTGQWGQYSTPHGNSQLSITQFQGIQFPLPAFKGPDQTFIQAKLHIIEKNES